ncbi:hypothetical protein ABW17_26835 [Mycobacterium nebraskense]|nr:hypothetical protein ABW17_26835 [Mycobacterium nebraskense]
MAMAIFRQTENGMTDGVVHIIGTSSSKQVPESPSRAGTRPEDKVPLSVANNVDKVVISGLSADHDEQEFDPTATSPSASGRTAASAHTWPG